MSGQISIRVNLVASLSSNLSSLASFLELDLSYCWQRASNKIFETFLVSMKIIIHVHVGLYYRYAGLLRTTYIHMIVF